VPDGPAAAEPLARLDAAAERMETPCGDGAMAWRAWGAGDPLVLLHGGTGSWRHWVRNVEALARDRRVLAPDLPGLGESALPPPVREPGEIAAIVVDGLNRILGGGARFDICGFSFGALVSGHVAAREGRRLRSVTIVGAGALGLPRQPTPLTKVRDKAGADRLAAHRANLASLMFADPSRIDALALAIQEWNTVHARFKSRGFAQTASLRDALARAVAPLHAIWGERDAIAWPHVAERVDAIRSLRPDARIAVIAGAGHWVAYEAADAFNAALETMLRARP